MGEQGAFLAADAAADLHDNAFFVVGIFGQQQNLQLTIKLFAAGFRADEGLLAKFLHFRVAHKLLSICHLLQRGIIGVEGLHDGL